MKRHKAPITIADDAGIIRLSHLFFVKILNRVRHIVLHKTAPLTIACFSKFLPETGGASEVYSERLISPHGKILVGRVIIIKITRFRPTMRHH